MQAHQQEIRENGAAIFLIGNGAPHFIAGFREITNYEGPIFTDPSLGVYQAAQLVRSKRATLGLRSIANGARSFFKGSRQGSMQGDPWQQGGSLVVSTTGELLYVHQSQAGGDNSSADALIAALR